MKRTLLILTLLVFAVTLYPADAVYYDHHILFSLEKHERPLSAEECKSLETPYPQLNAFIRKYDVQRIERWLPNAKPHEHDGDVYLNRIYRLILKKDIPADLALTAELKELTSAIGKAELEPVVKKYAIPDDPYIKNQWFLSKVQATEAWKLWDLQAGEKPGDSTIVIAIVDDGVEYTHPDLEENIWINQDEIPGIYVDLADTDGDGYISAREAINFCGDANGDGIANLKDVIHSNSLFVDDSDNDGDGYISNIIGWDTDLSADSSDDDNDPMPKNNSHGTHVAGLAGAVTNNGVGVASVAYNISIMPVKATGDETTESINTGYDGMLYAAHAGADIINCSWGGPGYSSFMQNQINVLCDQYDAIIVAAAGNGDDEGNPSDEAHYPSGYDNVVSVTAVSSQDIFSWASYGAPDPDNNFYGVDLSAPGENMYSTYLTKIANYTSLRGTSMASPLVASCFGLLKSFYPDSSREWLIRRLVDNTDPVDDLNPDYAGKIGSGRVNILKALVSDKWPKLRYVAHEESIVGGDADSVLNPGEGLIMMIELENDTGWAEANEIMGILRSDHPGITITDSVGVWNSILPNHTALNDDDGFQISFSAELLPADYSFTLELLSGQTDEFPYNTTLDIVISLYLDQQGFPFYAENEVEASPLFLDIEDNGQMDIVFGDKSGNLYVVNAQGEIRDGFPIGLGGQIGGIAVADLDLDNIPEIVVTLFDKAVHVYNINGEHKWSRHIDGFIPAMPAIGNLDDDAELEVVVGTFGQKLYVMNHDSSDVNPFPYSAGQRISSGVSLADVNGDGKDEIIFGGMSGELNIIDAAGNTLSGWPQSTSGSISSEPFVHISDENTAIILIANDQGDIYGFDLDGSQRFMIGGSGAIKASPAVYMREENIFAAFGSIEGNIYLVDVLNGTLVDNWPQKISNIYNSLACADVTDDTETAQHILALGNDGRIYAFTHEGEPVNGFPINTRFLSKSSPAITDIDNDNDNEIICGTYAGVSVIDLKGEGGTVSWAMHRGGIQRRGSVYSTISSAEDTYLPFDFEFELIGNAPNPFNPGTMIRFIAPGPDPVKLQVFSLDGKQVIEQNIREPEIGMNDIFIDMSNFASGIYVYTLSQKHISKKAKMILLK